MMRAWCVGAMICWLRSDDNLKARSPRSELHMTPFLSNLRIRVGIESFLVYGCFLAASLGRFFPHGVFCTLRSGSEDLPYHPP